MMHNQLQISYFIKFRASIILLQNSLAAIQMFCKFIFWVKKKMVRVKGLEPSHLSIPEPKSGASTNFATPAQE